MEPKRYAVFSPRRCAGSVEQAFFTDTMQSIADPNLYACIGRLDTGPEVARMQLADRRLEVEPCRCRARLLHRCFVVSHTHTTPPKTTPDAKQLDGTPTVRASRGALVVPT
jgi:hypothetical protein